MQLNDMQKAYYKKNGFLILENFISAPTCDLLMKRATSLIEEFDPQAQHTVFSTDDEQLHFKQDYFINSGDKVHFFFEKEAFDSEDRLIKDKMLSINKIGHALHDLDPVFDMFSRQHKIASLVTDLGISNPLLLQSMYICKQPFIGGEVTCHQDSTYLYVKEQPVIGLWFALEDATLHNGCLWAIPAGHLLPLKARSIQNGNDATLEVYDPTPWPIDQMIPLEVPRGSVIVLHGLLPHMSKENKSPQSRHAYSLHIISADYEYPADNWLQRSAALPLRGF